MGKSKLFIIAAVVLAGCGLFFGFRSYKTWREYKLLDDTYAEIASTYRRVHKSGTATARPGSVQADDAPEAEDDADPFPIDVDFNALLDTDEHVVAWIYSEDTPIDYPVLKGTDNFYYLTNGMKGDYTGYGAIFMDCANNPAFIDANTILYGHHMQNGSMFASIARYKTQEFYDQHPQMWLATPTKNYRVDIYSCYVTNPDSESYTIRFKDDSTYAEWLQKTIDKSLIQAEVMPTIQTQVLTLSTCSYEYSGARCVIHGILTPVA